ncbi:MAG: hypothetical protein A3B70_03270 [Deltaproteobacteria bacterium RIFCSPHIGHO2_02_FULL_40_11]|nr:MAG: hypothetical protein A3B70_03270 [Deltaproteobacteria bacterium RIFCSPHIGHO2_02_FULL_40_11]
MRRPPKTPNLLSKVGHCLDQGRYLDTRHASLRQRQRWISRIEVLYVLRNGFHEQRKDKFDMAFKSWNYAVRGKTIDKRDLRIIVSFDENNMLIITAIELS